MGKKKPETNGTAVVEQPEVQVAPPPAEPKNNGVVIRVFSYPVKEDTVIQALVHETLVTKRDGSQFVAHGVTTQKVWTTATGDKKSLYTFRCSELYALQHAISRAEAYILDLREDNEMPF